MNKSNRGAPSVGAQTLGYGGLIPFVGLALAAWFMPAHQPVAATAFGRCGDHECHVRAGDDVKGQAGNGEGEEQRPVRQKCDAADFQHPA